MRLIDADAIKYEHHEKIGMGIDYGVNENSYYDIAYKTQIDKMPTIEPKQRVAHWIWMGDKGDSRFMCSVCKWKENVPTIMGKPDVWDYCPSCGCRIER